MKTLLNILILAVLATTGARAGIVVAFDHPDQTGNPGDTLQFFGTITNTGADTVFLNGDPMTLAGLSFTINDLFFDNVPVSLDGGTNSGDIELFDVTLSNPLLDAPGLYLESYNLVGGVDGEASDNLGSAPFSLTTEPGEPGVPGVPEPGTFLLLGSALLGLGAGRLLHRRRT